MVGSKKLRAETTVQQPTSAQVYQEQAADQAASRITLTLIVIIILFVLLFVPAELLNFFIEHAVIDGYRTDERVTSAAES